jgi:hypothetical protein
MTVGDGAGLPGGVAAELQKLLIGADSVESFPASRVRCGPHRVATRASSRAGWPGVRSTMPVACWVDPPAGARCQACSSTPIAVTPSSRAGSSTWGWPSARTRRMIVCQDTPNPRAWPATVAPLPIASNLAIMHQITH